jgi:hypothetical protein
MIEDEMLTLGFWYLGWSKEKTFKRTEFQPKQAFLSEEAKKENDDRKVEGEKEVLTVEDLRDSGGAVHAVEVDANGTERAYIVYESGWFVLKLICRRPFVRELRGVACWSCNLSERGRESTISMLFHFHVRLLSKSTVTESVHGLII